LVLFTGALAVASCDRYLDAVTDCSLQPQPPTNPACAPTSWPIDGHGANSDPWLSGHRTVLTEMRPRVLVLNFENAATEADARAAAERLAVGLAEGSRYHAYSNPNAPIFLRYEIVKVVDLRDNPIPANWTNPSSTRLPIGPMGAFDPVALFSAQFNELYGFDDPDSATPRALSLCELFERGLINEVWILDGEYNNRQAPLSIDRKQMYDQAEQKIPGSFAAAAGGAEPLEVVCGVSVRLGHLDRQRGPGCDLFVRGWGIEDMASALPSLRPEAQAFLNRDFDERFGTRFSRWSEICPYQVTGDCVTYPTPTTATGTYSDGMSWTIDPFLQGCGSSEFAPNASFMNDNNSQTPVQSRCEHFGLRDGPNGQDTYEVYAYAKVAELDMDPRFRDCAGGWQIYWRQSVPGYQTKAVRADGRATGNWWPYLFY
jgi:hypothetical protein